MMEEKHKCHLVSAPSSLIEYARERNKQEVAKLIRLSEVKAERSRALRERVIEAICKFAEKLGW